MDKRVIASLVAVGMVGGLVGVYLMVKALVIAVRMGG